LEANVDAIIETCCGLDVHQASVVASLLTGKANQKPKRQVRTFRTVTRELTAMCEWLRTEGCTHIAMESTGVYWKPVYAVLEDGFELVVGNAHHIRNVPGRKTDVKDSEWLADLLRHGLIRKSFVPPKPMRELRDLLRYRRKLVESAAAERNRLLAVLETANIKLANVASDVFGVSGRRMLEAIIEGTSSPAQMAQLAKGKLRDKLAELQLALEGSVQPHHRFLLATQLRRIKSVEDDLAQLDKYIDEKLEPYREQHKLLMTIPGVSWLVAAVLIAEIGVDMSVFPTVRHLAAWAGLAPGNHESAGKRKGGKARRGNVYLKTALVAAATSAARTKRGYLRDKYYRLKARRGGLRAAVAIAHKILVAAFHILSHGVTYKDLGDDYLDNVDRSRTAKNLVRRLERLGFEVDIKAANSQENANVFS
jgi:transposase